MKKVFILLPLVILLFSSCEKKEPAKDLDTSIKKLNLFNNTFAKLYSDGVISTEKVGDKNSEYDQLKKLASEYYESINKINNAIADEKEEGIAEYEKVYKQELENRKAEIEKATQLFTENLNKLNGTEESKQDEVTEQNKEAENTEVADSSAVAEKS